MTLATPLASSIPTTIDVRGIPPEARHATLLAAFRALAVDEALVIVNDHDPRPLYHQFQAAAPDSFSWDYAQSGPAVWRVVVRMLAPAPAPEAAGTSCCGHCGGA